MNARRSIAPSAASSGTASAKPKAFDLYGMTEDEIKIVEGNGAKQ